MSCKLPMPDGFWPALLSATGYLIAGGVILAAIVGASLLIAKITTGDHLHWISIVVLSVSLVLGFAILVALDATGACL